MALKSIRYKRNAVWWKVIREAFLLRSYEWISYEDIWSFRSETHRVVISYKIFLEWLFPFDLQIQVLNWWKFISCLLCFYFLFLCIFVHFFIETNHVNVESMLSLTSILSCFIVHFHSFSFCFVWIPHTWVCWICVKLYFLLLIPLLSFSSPSLWMFSFNNVSSLILLFLSWKVFFLPSFFLSSLKKVSFLKAIFLFFSNYNISLRLNKIIISLKVLC